MARLIAPNGSTVSVSAEKAERLRSQGYRSVEDKKAASKTSTRKSQSED